MVYRLVQKFHRECVALYKGQGDWDWAFTALVPSVGSYEICVCLTEDEAVRVLHYDEVQGSALISMVDEILAIHDEAGIRARQVPFQICGPDCIEIARP